MTVIEQTYGSLREATYALDRSWWNRAACHGWIRRSWVPTPWNVASSDEPVNGVPCHKLVDLALIICSACPAQYDCARYATAGLVNAGTWGMRVKLLQWLQKQPDGLDIIDQAEAEKAVVQVFVRNAKRERTGD